MWKRFSYAFALVAVAAIAVFARDIRIISVRDDCDKATFNATFGPGICVGDGDTTVEEFLAEFDATGNVEKWRFNNDRTEADRTVKAENRGGETHTFTPVAHFGGGFISRLNGDQEPLTECVGDDPVLDDNGNFVPGPDAGPFIPAGRSTTMALTKGTHRFQCCIHPWMRSTVTVR
jgi:hypothetical protein